MRKVIIIGGNHVNTLGLIRSIGERGLPVILFLEHQESLSACNLRFSKYITMMYHLTTEADILTLLKRDFWNEASKPVILCASDLSICLLDEHYEELKVKFFFFNAGQQGRISHFMNKANMFSLAEACGLRTIKTWLLKEGVSIPEDITYPCFSKPQNSAMDGKTGTGLINNREELQRRLKCGGRGLLVQEYIDKDYEVDINGFSYNFGENVIINAVCRKIRDYIDRQSQYIVLEDISVWPNINYTAIKEFIKSIGYEGLFSIELVCKDDTFFFLEINMRSDGVNYLYTSAGFNYPFLWYRYGVDGKLDSSHVSFPKLRRPLYLMQWTDFVDVFHKRISFWQWLKDLARTRAFCVLSIRDPKPFLFVIWQNIKLVLQKLHFLR